MGQLKGLWRDTWWLWLMFVAIVVVLAVLVSPYFLIALAMLPVTFCYFAFVRYDHQGRERPDF